MKEKQTDITIDPLKLVAVKGDSIIDLTLQELRLLAFFLANKGKIVTREDLAKGWHGKDLKFSNIIDVYVNYLRKKIGKEMITTVRGEGYVYGQEVAA